MKIESIGCKIPSKKIDNEEVIDLIRFYSHDRYVGDLKLLIESIRNLLTKTGINTRYWCDKRELPIDLIAESVEICLKEANLKKKDIDVLIYVSVDRGFIEPANACFISKKLNLNNLRAFDIVDACMGWTTALQVSQAILSNNEAEKILIISSECPMDRNGTILPKSFQLENKNQLAYKFPAYTIGEAVSSTLVVKSPLNWKFYSHADYNNADLCTIPLYKYQRYSTSSPKLCNRKEFEFAAFGKELFFAGYHKAFQVLNSLLSDNSLENSLILPHSVSMQVPNRVQAELANKYEFYTTFPNLGNVATSSIPVNLYFARLKSLLKKECSPIGWVASGGLKYAAYRIYY